MTQLFLLLLAGAAAAPAAQPPVAADAGKATSSLPAASCSPEHAAMGHCTLPAPAVSESQVGHDAPAVAAPACPPEHAAMGHCKPAPGAAEEGADAGAAQVPVAPPPPESLTGPEHAADTVWSADAMATARGVLLREHGDIRVGKIMLDRVELAARQGRDGYAWDAQAWWGGDLDKIWLKSEGEGNWGRRVERAELQALWSHAIGPWFDLQAGVRHDFEPGPERSYLALGVEGLAPYWVQVEGAVFLSDKGELSAQGEVEHDLRLSQRLMLQPRAAFDLQFQDVPERRIGSGLERGEAGLRLRYEITPQFAPYAGFGLDRSFGETARRRRAAGEDAGGWSLLFGIRAWF